MYMGRWKLLLLCQILQVLRSMHAIAIKIICIAIHIMAMSHTCAMAICLARHIYASAADGSGQKIASMEAI